MSGRPTTANSSRPYTAASSEYRPQTAWTDSEPPSTAHGGAANYAYPTQQYVQSGQHNHLYAQEEEEEEESEDEDVFAYLPPGTAQSDVVPPPHQPALPSYNQHNQHNQQYQQQQQQQSSFHQHQTSLHHVPSVTQPQATSAAQLHNLVAAAGLDGSGAGGASSPYTRQINPTTHTTHHTHITTTHNNTGGEVSDPTSNDDVAKEFGPDAYSMRPIPFSPGPGTGTGMFSPTSGNGSTNANNNTTSKSFPRSADSREVRVDLPSTSVSFSSSYAPNSPGLKRRVSSEMNTSVMDMATTLKYTEEAGGMEEEEEDSPYAEVRASVSNTDDPEMPALTIRMWFCGMLLCIIAISMNTFFNFRYPSPLLTPLVVLLVAYPMGRFFAIVMPIQNYYLPAFLGGGSFSLNPGPFNVKEHILIYMMANIAAAPSYAMNTIVVSSLFYGLDFGVGWELMFLIATQMTGLGLAGMARQFLVFPASMVWPANLVMCTLMNTLHAGEDTDRRGGMTRYKFFLYVMGGTFAYTFLPAFLFQALSFFSWVCWIAPNNLVVNQLFGTYSGLGMGLLTFDWAQIAWIGSPLMIPWWAQVHVFIGFVLLYWFALPILYYTNVWKLGYLPMGGQASFDRFGKKYQIMNIFNTTTKSFDLDAYMEYSALYLPGPYALVYLLAFTLASCILTHTILYHGKTILNGLKKVQTEEEDIHFKLMRKYPEVPDSWYLTIVIAFFMLVVVAIEIWPTGMPVWGMALSLIIPILYLLPCGLVFAVTGQGIAINLIVETIPGALLAGKPLPNMIFKAYSIQVINTALSFVMDLKLGHYMKVPPRASFHVQTVSSLIVCFVQVGVKRWLFANVKDMCSPEQKDFLTCPHNGVFFTASAIWGLIGPTRQFGPGTMYHGHLYALIVGALLPIPFWWWQRRNPKSRLRYVNIPVALNGPSYIPPARGINYSSWFIVGFIFQYVIRRRHFRWWSKFNYILSAALDSGTILAIVFIFLTLQLPFANGGLQLDWWGNNVFLKNLDFAGLPARTLGQGEAFDKAPNGNW
ncbi:putative oligopeptide transporter [Serendipita vermifera]|nr:putative oligopeptide transporter [Serendipita vermifera]